MSKFTKNRKKAIEKLDALNTKESHSVEESISIVKEVSTERFDASVDLAVQLNVDAKKSDQMVRGSVSLPHGTGKQKKILAFVTPDKEEEAKAAGADYVGLEEYVQKIKGGWTDIDAVVTVPAVMPKLAPLARILGPRGLMPNPKTGTVSPNIGKAITDIKAGKIDFKIDKTGVIHVPTGRVSFDKEKLSQNIQEIFAALVKAKPSTVKGNYVKSIYISSTMGPSIRVDEKSVVA